MKLDRVFGMGGELDEVIASGSPTTGVPALQTRGQIMCIQAPCPTGDQFNWDNLIHQGANIPPIITMPVERRPLTEQHIDPAYVNNQCPPKWVHREGIFENPPRKPAPPSWAGHYWSGCFPPWDISDTKQIPGDWWAGFIQRLTRIPAAKDAQQTAPGPNFSVKNQQLAMDIISAKDAQQTAPGPNFSVKNQQLAMDIISGKVTLSAQRQACVKAYAEANSANLPGGIALLAISLENCPESSSILPLLAAGAAALLLS